MNSRALAVPVALLMLGCTGDAKQSDTTASADTASAASADSVVLAPIGGSTDARSSSGTPRGRPGVGGLGSRRASTSGTGGTSATTGGGTSARASGGTGRAADARGVRTDTAVSTSSGTSKPDSTVSQASAPDTARGIVAVVGTANDSRVVLRPAGGGRSVTLVGPEARIVGRLSGADVWASGNRDQYGQLRVSRFMVRTVDGNRAMDGTLIARGDRLLLVTRDGQQHAIGNPPPALRAHVGARVWLTGPLDTGPITFGVIDERR